MMDVKELPKGVKVPKGVADSQGNIVYLKEAYPASVTTCLRGKCNDKDGCGVGINDMKKDDCSCGSCKIDKSNDEESSQEYQQHLVKRLKQIDY